MTLATHVILLKGVNVGKAKRVPMIQLKEVLAGLGCKDVTTLLNSGNAVVSASASSSGSLARKVSAALRATFGFEVPVVVKSWREFSEIVAANELAKSASDHSRLLVVFVQESAVLKRLESMAGAAVPPDRFLLGGKGAYLYCPNGILESKSAATLLGKAGTDVTTRNWATVLKLHAIASARSARKSVAAAGRNHS
jgi:uncharacterized protein (DUF1697 family)